MFTLKVSKRSETCWKATLFTASAAWLYHIKTLFGEAGLVLDINYRPVAECPAEFSEHGGTFKVNVKNNLTQADVEYIDQQITLLNLQIQRRLDKMKLQRDWFNEFLPLALSLNG